MTITITLPDEAQRNRILAWLALLMDGCPIKGATCVVTPPMLEPKDVH